MAANTIRVEGLRELQRDFRKMSKELGKDLRAELLNSAAPVADRAQQRTLGEIGNMTSHWSQMRVGVTSGSVYVVPRAKRRGGSPRPNLKPLIQSRMDQALDDKRGEVMDNMGDMLDRLADRSGF